MTPDSGAALRPGTGARGLAAAALLIAGITVLARVMGFARTVVFAHTVGPTCLGDTYSTANAVPNIVFDVVAGGALSSLVVPVLAGAVASGERARVDQISSALLTWAVLLLVPVAVLAGLFTRPLMSLLLGGGGHAGCPTHVEVVVGARMLLVFLPQIVLYGLGVVLTGLVQSHRRFLGPALGPLLSSVVVVAAYTVFEVMAGRQDSLRAVSLGHQLVLSVGTTLGVLALVAPLLRPARRTGVRLRPTTRFPPGVARTVRRMAVAGAVVVASQDLATAVVLRLCNSHGSDGAVVVYTLAQSVFTLPWAVLAVPLATSAFPQLTACWQDGDREGYASVTARGLSVLVPVVAGAAVLVGVLAGPLARLIVLGPGSGSASVALARALVGFAPGVPGYALTALCSRALYAQNNARTPAAAMAVGWLVSIGIDIVVVGAVPGSWTVTAIAVGNSVGMTVAGGWLLLALRRSAGVAALRGTGRAWSAAAAGSIVTGALAGAGVALWQTSGLLDSAGQLVALGALATAVYALVVAAVDRTALRLVLAAVASRGRWARS